MKINSCNNGYSSSTKLIAQIYDKDDDDIFIPMLTIDFLRYITTLDLKDKTLLEIGAGNSTVFWQDYFKKIITYEDDFECYEQLQKTIDLNKVELKFFKCAEDFLNKQFLDEIYEADYIIIDNDTLNVKRLFFCELASRFKKPSSSIVLDNSNWNIEEYKFLNKNFFVKDFPGFNYRRQLTATSIFEIRKDLFFTFEK